MNKINFEYFYQNQLIVYISLLITLTILLSFFLYPKTELTLAIFKENLKALDLDENGKIRNTLMNHFSSAFLGLYGRGSRPWLNWLTRWARF